MPYTYLWSNSATTASITGVGSGTYTVTVTDNNGASSTANGTITEPNILTIGLNNDSLISCFNANSGVITTTLFGGTSPYTYDWSNGATTASISGISKGMYSVTVTDANGCTIEDSSLMVLTDPTCGAPINLRTIFIQDTAATLNWSHVSGAISYKVVMKVAGTPNWSTVNFVRANRLQAAGLTPNTVYVWSVMVRTASGWSKLAYQTKFKTLITPCLDPTNIGITYIEDSKARLEWTITPSVVKTRLRYREQGTSAWSLANLTAPIAKYWMIGLNANTTYEYQIKSVCAYGLTSGNRWMPLQSFKTDSLPAPKLS